MSRRVVLGTAVGATALGVPAVLSALRSKARAADGLPLTVVNDTRRFGNTAVRMYIVGTDLRTGRQGYVRTSGEFTPCSPSDNTVDGFADLGVPLALSGPTTIRLPKMSGRVYFSINAPLRFRVVGTASGSALQFPAGWVATDPSFGVMHDCIEFTYNDAGMFCNTTMVDMFSIPLAIRLTGARTQTTGTLVDGGRDRIFAAVRALPEFAKLVIGDNLRVVAPGHGIDSGLFPPTYFDSYVDQVWRRYTEQDLTVTTNAGTFTGRVTGDRLTFSGGVASFARPRTRDVLFCDGHLAAPNDGRTGPVAAVLGAAFNRATLLDQARQPVADPAGFYRGTTANHYSRVLHANTVDGKAYGFAFDDVTDGAAYVEDRSPTGIQVTLTPFGAGNPDPGPSAVPPPMPSASATGASTPTATGAPGGGRDAFARIAADSHTAQSGTRAQSCAEGGRNIGWIANGDWLEYRDVAFGGRTARQFTVRVASGAGGGVSGLVEVRLDSRTSQPVGTVAVGNTGGWQSWRTVSGNLAAVSGTHTVYLTFHSGQPADFANVQWLTFGT